MKSEIDYKILNDILTKIDSLKTEIERFKPLDKDQENRIFQKFRLDWNYHSNAIEGNTLSQGETRAFIMEGLTAKGKPLKDHLDIKGHNEAIDFILPMIVGEQYFTEREIRELHQLILVEPYTSKAQTASGIPTQKVIKLGQYKSSPNHVKTPTGETHYYASPEETPAKMADLMQWFNENAENYHPLVLASLFHYKFVAIHPFDDGNGRMSRLLMNFILMKNQFPPVVIKNEDRTAYYNALSYADAGDLKPFIEFVGENLIHSLEIYLKGVKGEDISELGDFDKELQLFQKNILANQKHRNLVWTQEEQDRITNSTNRSLINNVAGKFDKLKVFFVESKIVMLNERVYQIDSNDFSDDDSFSGTNKIVTKYENVDTGGGMKMSLATTYSYTNFVKSNFKERRLNALIFQFYAYKYSPEVKNLEFQLHFIFDEYNYRLLYNINELDNCKTTVDFLDRNSKDELSDKNNLIFEKNYGEYLNEAEITEYAEKIGKKMLEEVKKLL